jgi:uncharacterized damage-inducible protein DinB
MRLSDRILVQLTSTYDGNAWHGTPLRKMLEGVDETQANARPIANARTIAELTAHVTAWIEIAAQRAQGEQFEVTPEIDFPNVEGVAWIDTLSRLDRAHAQLIEIVRGMSDAQIDANVPGKSYTNEFLLQGVAHHNTYHAAQIAMLKK